MATHALAASSSTSTAIPRQNRSRLCSIHPAQNNLNLQTCGLRSPWLGVAGKLSLQSRNLRPLVLELRSIKATIVFSLPTVNPERLSSSTDEVPRWSSKAIKSFSMAELEARKLKYPTTGTESLLMGILIEGTNIASKFLWANGIKLLKVREETVKLIARGEMLSRPMYPPLSEDAQKALDWALDEKLKSGDSGEVTTAHMLLGVWSQEESPGHKILASLGLNDEKVKELKSKILEPGILDD